MIRSISLVIALSLGLIGCVETQPPAQTSPSAVVPGTHPVDSASAMSLISDICVDTLPRFANAPAVLAKMPFQQNPQTGTYYHRSLDLSIKLHTDKGRKICSMVFVSKDDPAQLALLIPIAASSQGGGNKILVGPDMSQSAVALAGGARLTFQPIGQNAGKKYYNITVTAAK